MDKFLITFTSSNPITGPMLVTTSPRRSCPTTCPLRGAACYAERGYLGGFIWKGLDDTSLGGSFGNGIRVYSFNQVLNTIRCLKPGEPWRHNQAGDLVSHEGNIDLDRLRQLTAANTGKFGITYTHHDVVHNAHNREAIREAVAGGFIVNLSANDLSHADQLAAVDVAPVAVIVPDTQRTNTVTPKGRKVVICPARIREGVTCSSCKLCARNRTAIIGLPELSLGSELVRAPAAPGSISLRSKEPPKPISFWQKLRRLLPFG